jgi:ubiquinone/menaquinone biosynthesis C-methylase UbiE
MNELSREAIEQSGYRRDGFAEHYDAFRPKPPPVLLDALTRYAGGPPLQLVVDLGSGTGLSTRAWAERAQEIVGVEPNPAMLAVAEAQTPQKSVRFVESFADATGMPAGAADLVTCSQSFHWMERGPALAEAARILRAGGVFAAYDYDIPPLVDPEIDAVFADHLALRRKFREVNKLRAGWTRTPKAEHLDAIRESGRFRHAREVVLHDEQEVDAARILGLARSLGLVPELKALGVSEEELGLERLTETTQRVLGASTTVWLLSYRIRLGVK